MTDAHVKCAVIAQLDAAHSVTQMLHAAGVKVLAHVFANGLPLLLVNRPPTGVTGTLRRKLALADGRHELTYRALYEGARIEWREIIRPPARVDLAVMEVLGNA